MRRFRLPGLALTLALAATTAAAAADDRATCTQASGEVALAACDRAIASGQYKGVDLARLHTNRGVERKRKGDLDGAIV
jgi:hypothetical protein